MNSKTNYNSTYSTSQNFKNEQQKHLYSTYSTSQKFKNEQQKLKLFLYINFLKKNLF